MLDPLTQLLEGLELRQSSLQLREMMKASIEEWPQVQFEMMHVLALILI